MTTVPSGDGEHQVVALGAGLVVTRTLLAVAGALVGSEVEVEQRGHVAVDDQRDAATVAAVAAVRAAEWDELFPVDAGAAVAAVATADVHGGAVDEASGHVGSSQQQRGFGG